MTTRLRGLRACQVWAEPATGRPALPESVADTIALGSAGGLFRVVETLSWPRALEGANREAMRSETESQ